MCADYHASHGFWYRSKDGKILWMAAREEGILNLRVRRRNLCFGRVVLSGTRMQSLLLVVVYRLRSAEQRWRAESIRCGTQSSKQMRVKSQQHYSVMEGGMSERDYRSSLIRSNECVGGQRKRIHHHLGIRQKIR